MSSAVHHDPVCMGTAPLSVTGDELIARYNALPDTIKSAEGGGILAWALYHSRCIFAEYLYTVNVVVSDWALLDRRVDKSYIIRHASDTLLKYCVTDNPSELWLDIYAEELAYVQGLTYGHAYTPTESGFMKILESLKSTFRFHPKRGVYVMDVRNLNWLIGHHFYRLSKSLINAGYVLPNGQTLMRLWQISNDHHQETPNNSIL